jgi:hypothetical protein
MSFLLLRLGITHLNLPENNLRLNQDYESNPVMRIITIIHGSRRKPRAQPIRDLLVVSIDINNLQVAAGGAAKEWHRKRENEYACNESGAI